MTPAPGPISQTSLSELEQALAEEGLFVDYGACVVRLRSRLKGFAHSLRGVYGSFAFMPEAPFADLHVRVDPGRGLRRWLRPNARFSIDGVEPFDPFPLASALPLYEWGVNWCFAQRFNQHVLLHAGALARAERAVIMAATPGSGKSTLSAAMMLRGFRLLSDEFGVLCPESGALLPMLKPVALKNQSIDLIRGFSGEAVLGPVHYATRKGDVAHLAPDAASVAAMHRPARPALVIFPRWREGAALAVEPQAREQAFARLAFNSFNYRLLGPVSFDAVADLAAACPAVQLTYSRLDEAIEAIHRLLDEPPAVGGVEGER
ncbi:MAG: HprK-related kinase A [Thauera phenolivorans]|uniref:HprK-related kinase A n=2 Tax=Thauera phenolivorans TaxID=1792543 RepID=A0A7X7LXA9_9RHOO|nr:HprK-related kinase A [Thauera phenolivorans]NLF54576.1 HprK-related kinase A [Thauera phenolivorans]